MWKKSWLFLIPFLAGAAEPALEKQPCEGERFIIPATEKSTAFTVGKRFVINPSEVVSVTFSAQAVGRPREFGKITAGFRQFAANGRLIYSAHVNCQPGTDTALAAPLEKGGKSIKVKNAAWKADGKKTLVAVFNTRADRSDLPNFSLNTTCNRIVRFTPSEDGCVTAELSRPAPAAFPAGTPVRLHFWGREAEHQFACWPLAGAERKYAFKKEGGEWWPGAKEAQLIFTFSCRSAFKGLKLKLSSPEVKKTAVEGDLW